MVAREIGEHRHIECQRRDASLCQSVRRHLHRYGTSALLAQIGQIGLHADRVRRSVATQLQLTMKTCTQRANDPAALTKPIESLGDQVTDAGLAIGSCHASQMQTAARLTVETPRNRRELAGEL